MFKCGNYGHGLFAATAGSLRRLVNIVGCSLGAAADVLLSDPYHVSSTKAKNGAKGLWLHPHVACAEVSVTTINNRKCHLPLVVLKKSEWIVNDFSFQKGFLLKGLLFTKSTFSIGFDGHYMELQKSSSGL